MCQGVSGRRAPAGVWLDTREEGDEVPHAGVDDVLQGGGGLPVPHLAVNVLRFAVALAVRQAPRHQLQQQHAHRVHVHTLVIGVVKELGCHEVGCAAELPQAGAAWGDAGGHAQVRDENVPRHAVKEDVAALDVAVHDGGVQAVQVLHPLQHLVQPALDNFQRRLVRCGEAGQRPRPLLLRDEHQLRLRRPREEAAQDARVPQLLQQRRLLLHLLPCLGVHAREVHLTPRHLPARLRVEGLVPVKASTAQGLTCYGMPTQPLPHSANVHMLLGAAS